MPRTSPLWADHNFAFLDTNALLQYHHTQLIANYLEPTLRNDYDLSGICGKETKKPRVAKKELLRKRQNARMDDKRRQTESGTPKGFRQERTKASRLDTRTHRDLEMGPSQVNSRRQGIVSPTSAVECPDTPDEDIPRDQERSDETEGNGDENKTRLKHNKVERRYRQRLNNHYERLLGILPRLGDLTAPETEHATPQQGASNGGHADVRLGSDSSRGGDQLEPDGGSKQPEALASPTQSREKAVSKSEVLERAKSYIKCLEDEHQRLVAERDELLGIWEASRRKCEEVGPV